MIHSSVKKYEIFIHVLEFLNFRKISFSFKEPTSGLDYKTAFSLIRVLQTYASSHGKTVISTIHQPSSQMFRMFDLLLLMCEGHVSLGDRILNVYTVRLASEVTANL